MATRPRTPETVRLWTLKSVGRSTPSWWRSRTADYTVIGLFTQTPGKDLLLLERWCGRCAPPASSPAVRAETSVAERPPAAAAGSENAKPVSRFHLDRALPREPLGGSVTDEPVLPDGARFAPSETPRLESPAFPHE